MKAFKNSLKVFLLVISVSWSAQAYLIPGQPGGGGNVGPYPGNPGGGGGLVPGQPGHPGHPSHPPSPPYPNDPYPGNPYPGNPYPGDPYPGNPYPNDPYPNDPYPGQPGYQTEIKRAYIGRPLYNESLPLRQLTGIGPEYRGWEVVSVRATIRSGRVLAQLIADGRVVATQNNADNQIYLVPQYRLVISDTMRDLQLGVSGGLFVESVEVELRRNGGGYDPNPGYGQNIEINVYRSVSGNDRVDLSQYVDLQRYRGRVVEQVLVTATARYNSSFIDLLINGFNMGQAHFSGGYPQIATFRMNQHLVIGQGADSLVLYTQGDMDVEHVTIVIR